MITRNFNLFLNAGHSIPLVINVNQAEEGEQWVFSLFQEDGTPYIPTDGSIVGIKSDGYLINNSGTVVDGKVVIAETRQMTAAAGKAVFELRIDGLTHGTANFIVMVQEDPTDGGIVSDSDLSLIEEALSAVSPLPTGGTVGQVLTKTANGSTWSDAGTPTQEQVAEAVSDWADENITVTTGVVIDTSLAVAGAAADSAKVGQELSDLKSEIALNSGVPTEVKRALDTILQNVIFKNTDVYTDELAVVHNWASAVNLVSISAVFDSGTDTIYTDDTLEDLKQYLTVTANYDDGTSANVTTYTLSGELNAGQNTIVVTYEGKTASFSVTVVAPLYSLPNVAQTSASYDGRTSTVKIEDGLITISGNVYAGIYIDKNGNVSTTQPQNNPWFSVNSGTHFINKAVDISYNASSGANQSLNFKWANNDASGNLATASLEIDSASSETGKEATFELDPYTNNRTFSAFCFQWANMQSSGGTVSFRMRMFVDGVRYF